MALPTPHPSLFYFHVSAGDLQSVLQHPLLSNNPLLSGHYTLILGCPLRFLTLGIFIIGILSTDIALLVFTVLHIYYPVLIHTICKAGINISILQIGGG